MNGYVCMAALRRILGYCQDISITFGDDIQDFTKNTWLMFQYQIDCRFSAQFIFIKNKYMITVLVIGASRDSNGIHRFSDTLDFIRIDKIFSLYNFGKDLWNNVFTDNIKFLSIHKSPHLFLY